MKTLIQLGCAAALCVAAACTAREADNTAPKSYTFEETPEDLAPYRDKGKEGFASVGNRLIPRLMAALTEGGPAEGVKVCSGVAQELTAEAAGEAGYKIGRTSHKLRNPANATPDWLKPLVEASADKSGANVKPMVYDLGDRVGVASPIVLAEMCVQCHGAASEIDEETRNLINRHYPEDKATGFKPGEVRGWFWAEVPKS
jgi:hypothetical protein